ncbi:hypothetical protein [Spirillospora sp. NPDC047279]|uniref:hypothetical protein n=1 Tax=Spirillospora sp. NPDC047279 TaxID=3155478 RepID=UPI0033D7DBB4
MRNDPNAKRIENASHALNAYETSAFSDQPSLLPGDPVYAKALLGALICDLEHYAVHHGINFTDAYAAGRGAHADEMAEHAQYRPGDEVELQNHDRRRGTVTGVRTDPDREPSYFVEVPGKPYVVADLAANLRRAPAFPETETRLGRATTASQAERLFVKLAGRAHTAERQGDLSYRPDGEKLLTALSSWSGTPVSELLRELAPNLNWNLLPEAASSVSAAPATEADLADDDFPVDISNGIPSTPTSASTRQPDIPAARPSPESGPHRAA